LPATPDGTDWQAYYDDEADLTWAANAAIHLGSLNWANANTWVTTLTIGGVSGWRLPNTGSHCVGNCPSSELGNMFYNVLGGVFGTSIGTIHNANYDLFTNITYPQYFWSATEYVPDDSFAYIWVNNNNSQNYYSKNNSTNVWAVQSGNVGGAVVPVPAAVWLFGSGLIGLVGVARRKKVA
jgi:hypothetical protein